MMKDDKVFNMMTITSSAVIKRCKLRELTRIRSIPYNSSANSFYTNNNLSSTIDNVEGVWIFHRHGDRTPSISSDDLADNEAAFWRTKLPCQTLIEKLNNKFPPSIHASNSKGYFDAGRDTFGCLTNTGVQQMRDVGSKMALRYNRSEEDNFLSKWNVSVYSTNYLRTVTSAQCFLDGLLASPDTINNPSPISVKVRDRYSDTLNAFDRDPELMRELAGNVISSPSFVKQDTCALPLATRLARHIPGLIKSSKSSYGGPSGINWIYASDHFICRESHGVPLSARFDENGHQCARIDHTHEADLRSMAHPTLSHLSWRFAEWLVLFEILRVHFYFNALFIFAKIPILI